MKVKGRIHRPNAAMSKLFISHSSQDDGFVRGLQQALGDLGQDVWIDSRALRGGDPLWPEIQKAIEEASAYTVVVTTDGLQSKWVGKELRYALDVQKQRGNDKFRVFALSLDSTKLGVLEEFFDAEPLYMLSAARRVESRWRFMRSLSRWAKESLRMSRPRRSPHSHWKNSSSSSPT